MLRWLFGGKQVKPNEPSEDADKPEIKHKPSARVGHIGRLEILCQFREPANPESRIPAGWLPIWEQKLGIHPHTAIKIQIMEGSLVPSDPLAGFVAMNKLPDLKRVAKSLGLKVSGTKAEIAGRIFEKDPDLVTDAAATAMLYSCSAEALAEVESYVTAKKLELKGRQSETLQLLRKKAYAEASAVVCKHEVEQFFGRYDKHAIAEEEAALEWSVELLSRVTPGFHRKRWGSVSDEARVLSSMSLLWGTERFPEIFEEIAGPEPAAELILSARMLGFHISFLRHLEQFSALNLSGKVEIIAVENDGTCAACRKDECKTFSIKNVPELPHVNCICEMGCRCNVSFVSNDLDFELN